MARLRPLIVKAHVYLPGGGRKRGLIAAREHLRYMNNPKKEELVTDAEALWERGEGEAAIHARYMSERPGSQGLFGEAHELRPDQETLLREIVEHKGPVWRFFVSVHEDDAHAMGGALMRRQMWEEACRALVPKMAAEMNIPVVHVRWAAAMHRKEGHPHIHLLMWSADPAKGFLNRKGLDQVKRAWVSQLYGPERARLGREKSELRSAIGTSFRAALTRSDSDALAARFLRIAEALPGGGRLAYAYMPTEVKRDVEAAVDHLLSASPDLARMAAHYSDIAAEMAGHYSYKQERHQAARENAAGDLRRRLAGAVLRAALSMDERTAWQAIADDVFRAATRRPDASPALTALVQDEVSRLALRPGYEEALAAARRLFAAPELAERIAAFLKRAARRGPDRDAEARAARARGRLEASVAARLQRSAEYVRDARRFHVAGLYSGLGRALEETVRQAERDARLAEARALEEEAQRKRQAAAEADAR